MGNVRFDASSLDDLNRELLKMATEQFPKESAKFLRKQANETRKRLRRNTKAVTKKKTGNLLRGIDRGRVENKKDGPQIRVYNKAPHAPRIEHGHMKVLWGHRTEGFVPGKHPAAKTTNEMKTVFAEATEDFIDDLLKEGLHL